MKYTNKDIYIRALASGESEKSAIGRATIDIPKFDNRKTFDKPIIENKKHNLIPFILTVIFICFSIYYVSHYNVNTITTPDISHNVNIPTPAYPDYNYSIPNTIEYYPNLQLQVLKPDENGYSNELSGNWKDVSDGNTGTYVKSHYQGCSAIATYSISNPNHIGKISYIEVSVEYSNAIAKDEKIERIVYTNGIITNADTKLFENPQTQREWNWEEIDNIDVGIKIIPSKVYGTHIKVSEIVLKVYYY